MRSASGMVFQDGEFVEGSVEQLRGRLAFKEETDSGADVKGIILPKTVNCHTHLGDAFIQKPEKCTVEELVAPPNGYKHRMLRKADEQIQIEAMREAICVMASTGTSHFIDFRESGLEGTRRLLMASLGTGVTPVILGRPESSDVSEISALLSVAEGLGMSAISDMDIKELSSLSEQAKSSEKVFALHASEAKREEIKAVLGLKPDLLVHMVKATKADLKECARAKVPIAICPSSNMYFGLKPPVRDMLDSGITVCLGSDNAMLARPDILFEMRALRKMFSEAELSNSELFQIAFGNGRKVLNSLPGLGDANGRQKDFFVLEIPFKDPFKGVLGAGMEDVRLFTGVR